MLPFCQSVAVRPTRLIYVENDPALLGILARLLGRRDDLEVLIATDSVDEVLAFEEIDRVDVALLDLALGPHQMNGIDLGLALRRRNPNIGIVLHSQHPIGQMERQLPENELMGWSTVQKNGEMRIDELADVLKSTARGMSLRQSTESGETSAPLSALSARQRTIMGLAASGLSNREIARRMDSTDASVRQDLSKIYRVLVPDATEADDLRTRAVLAYLRLRDPETGRS